VAPRTFDPNRVLKPARKLRKLIGKLGRRPAPEEVHQLRTAARRFETLLETFSAEDGSVKSLLKHVRSCRKRAGKVRDMDVLTEYASKVRVAGEEECAVRLLEYLGAARHKHAKKLYTDVRRRRSGMRKELKDAAARLEDRIEANGNHRDSGDAAPHAAGAAVSLAVHLAQPERLTRENLHPYRLRVKKLRDVLHLASGKTAFSDGLDRVKDAIGEWHDWEDLVSIAQKKLDHGNSCGLSAELKRISQDKYEHAVAVAHEMRKTYLSPPPQRKSPGRAAPRLPVWSAIAKLTR
jgi:CHAD domain-containing protein